MDQLAAAANMTSSAGSMLILGSFAVLLFGYFLIALDRRREGSPNWGDGQVGLKLLLFTLLMVSLGLAVGATEDILGYTLAWGKNQYGAKGPGPLKSGIASLVAGGVGMAAVLLVCLPLTNYREYPQAERFTVGTVALIAGLAAVLGLAHTLQSFFGKPPPGWEVGRPVEWAPKAHALASLLVSAGLAVLSIMRFGSLSGWQAAAPADAQQGFPAQAAGGGYQQPGYQQPGYQQQPGGAYPQHTGNYPQPGQGGAPGGFQQGNYPPQQSQGGPSLPAPQGGGYPPSGGGYPPR